MAMTWRQAGQAMFGGDRLSATTHDIDEIDEKEGLKGGKDYNILCATFIRRKLPEKVKLLPDTLKTWRASGTGGKNTELPGMPLDPEKPPTAPFEELDDGKGCEDTCEVCFPQYFPAQRLITDEEALETTCKLAHGIADDYKYLQSILRTHADVIVQRWKKMSQQKRHKFLDSVSLSGTTNPGLYPDHPALIHLFNANRKLDDDPSNRLIAQKVACMGFPEDKSHFVTQYLLSMISPVMQEASKTKFHDSWLLPYLDTKTLSESPLPLLSLLHCRTKYPPHQWTNFDKMHIVGAEYSQVIGGNYSPHCINFHPDDYGALRQWDRSLAHREIIIGYTQGLYVLTAQSRMMSLLRKFVDCLLAEIQERSQAGSKKDGAEGKGSIGNNQSLVGDYAPLSRGGGSSPGRSASKEPASQPRWNQLVENGFSTFGLQPVVPWSSHTNQHLIAPPHADPVELHKKIQAVYQDAFDDLWALQTDPSSVQLAVRELCSCLYFHFLDKGKEWDRICDEVVLLPMRRELWWRQALKEADNLIKAYEAVKDDPNEDNQLRYDKAMLLLWECCTEQLTHAVLEMKDSIPYEPGFEKNYKWEQQSDRKRRQPKLHAKDWLLEDPLFWSLDCFCNDRYREFMCDPVVYLQVFDDQLRKASEKERRRISPNMMRRVGDLAAIDEIRTAIKCAPGINRHALRDFEVKFKYEWTKLKKENDIDAFNKVKNSMWYLDDIPSAAFRFLQKLCTEHSWPKGTPDATTLKRTAGARDALADMWRQVRKTFGAVVRREGTSGQCAAECVQKWSLDQSEDYKALKQEEQYEIQLVLEAKRLPRRTVKPTDDAPKVGQQQWVVSDAPESRNVRKAVLQDHSANRPKVKTHGEGLATEAVPVPDDTPDVALNERISVKQSSLVLLQHMFPLANGVTAEGGRSWKWQHFLDVMLDAGCNISQGSGSAVSFEHPSRVGRIVFHKPHPQPVIEPIILRRMGRRLRQRFSWGSDVFVVRE